MNTLNWRVMFVVLALFGSSMLAPQPASAQLGSLIVTMTAPSNGSTVSDTTTVSASVTIIGALTVAGVDQRPQLLMCLTDLRPEVGVGLIEQQRWPRCGHGAKQGGEGIGVFLDELVARTEGAARVAIPDLL